MAAKLVFGNEILGTTPKAQSMKENNKWNLVNIKNFYLQKILLREWERKATKGQLKIYLQGKNGDTDLENGCVDTSGEADSETNWESGMDKCALHVDNRHVGDVAGGHKDQLCDDLEGWGRGWEGGSWGREGIYVYW